MREKILNINSLKALINLDESVEQRTENLVSVVQFRPWPLFFFQKKSHQVDLSKYFFTP